MHGNMKKRMAMVMAVMMTVNSGIAAIAEEAVEDPAADFAVEGVFEESLLEPDEEIAWGFDGFYGDAGVEEGEEFIFVENEGGEEAYEEFENDLFTEEDSSGETDVIAESENEMAEAAEKAELIEDAADTIVAGAGTENAERERKESHSHGSAVTEEVTEAVLAELAAFECEGTSMGY